MLRGYETCARQHSLNKGKYHCVADLLSDWFGLTQTGKSVVNSPYTKQMNLNNKT